MNRQTFVLRVWSDQSGELRCSLKNQLEQATHFATLEILIENIRLRFANQTGFEPPGEAEIVDADGSQIKP